MNRKNHCQAILLCALLAQGCNSVRSQVDDARTLRWVREAALEIRLDGFREYYHREPSTYQRFRMKQAANFALERDADFFTRAYVLAFKEHRATELGPKDIALIKAEAQYAIDHPTYQIHTWSW